eukprot:jgi/Psemu1/12616/gm1.12616_g
MDLLKRIEAKQQQLFHSITVSKNYPEKLTNTHSISKLLEENQCNLIKYDLQDVFTIIVPEDKAFDETPGNLDFGKLKQVGTSSRLYLEFVEDGHLIHENLVWSFIYYEKNL